MYVLYEFYLFLTKLNRKNIFVVLYPTTSNDNILLRQEFNKLNEKKLHRACILRTHSNSYIQFSFPLKALTFCEAIFAPDTCQQIGVSQHSFTRLKNIIKRKRLKTVLLV